MAKKKAQVGDIIQFIRNGLSMNGFVTSTGENSVIVEIPAEAAEFLHYENNLTVVNHKNYKIVKVLALA